MSARFYITTPIYYITAAPHVGHAYSTIVADTLARYHRMRGHRTHFLTGTDEHGQKVQEKAVELGMDTKAFADKIAAEYRDAWPKLDIAEDDFIRTTEPRHESRVQELWTRVVDRGDIYLGEYEGWYCVADEAFYTEKELVNGKAPTGRDVERVKEPSYFFKLSKYTDILLDFYERNPRFVQPEERFNEVRSFVKSGLLDLSVSRTTFSWGVPVPGDPKHVMYVWFDALANYWTSLDTTEKAAFWPADLHLVGKEILRFHAVYWPAFLLAAGFQEDELPKQIFAHGWLTVDGEKMAKTTGNVIDPVHVANVVGADALRYYLLRAVSLGQDGDFSHEDLLARIRSELGNDFGNLLNRTLGLCVKYLPTDGGTGPTTTAYLDPTALEQELASAALEASGRAKDALDGIAPHRSLEAIWGLCRVANTYVDRAAPWAAQKAGDTKRVHTILASLLEVLRWLSLLLEPFIPGKAAETRRQLGLPLAVETEEGSDLWPTSWTPRPAGQPLAPGAPLFPNLTPELHASMLAELLPKATGDRGMIGPSSKRQAASAKVAGATPTEGGKLTGASADGSTTAGAGSTSTAGPTDAAGSMGAVGPAGAATPTGEATTASAAGAGDPALAFTPIAEVIDYETFAKADLRVGLVKTCEKVPKKDKLLSLTVDIGEPEPRRIIAGLALSFTADKLVGRRVVVVANLAPRDFGKGLVSHGMILAAGPSEALSLASVDETAVPGTKVK